MAPLIEAIQMPENSMNRSTLVYALETLDCSGHFLDVFRLALAEKVDVQISALSILQEQEFLVNDDDVETAVSLLEIADRGRIDYNWLVTYLEELRDG